MFSFRLRTPLIGRIRARDMRNVEEEVLNYRTFTDKSEIDENILILITRALIILAINVIIVMTMISVVIGVFLLLRFCVCARYFHVISQ